MPGSIPASPKDKMRVDATTTTTTTTTPPGTAESSSFSDLLSETVSYATSQARYYFFATPEEIEEDKEQVFLLPLTIFACVSLLRRLVPTVCKLCKLCKKNTWNELLQCLVQIGTY